MKIITDAHAQTWKRGRERVRDVTKSKKLEKFTGNVKF